jgi:hypothetical protein
MTDDDYKALKEDIRQYGLKNPIWIYEGQVLDGRNRSRACDELGIQPNYHTFYPGKATAIDFVVSMNLHRRHLDETQRGMVAGRLAQLPRGGDKTKVPIGTLTVEEASRKLNVSPRTTKRAHVVLKEGPPELIAECDAGETSLNDAVQQISKRKCAQRVLDEIPEDKRPESIEELQAQVEERLTILDRVSKISEAFHRISHVILKCRTGSPLNELFEDFDDRQLEWALQGVDEILSEFQEWRSEILRMNPSLKRALRQVN